MNGTLTVRRRSADWPAALRIAFGLVWAIDASLKWLPGFRSSFAAMLNTTAHGQPSWLRPWFQLWTGMSHTDATQLTRCTSNATGLTVTSGTVSRRLSDTHGAEDGCTSLVGPLGDPSLIPVTGTLTTKWKTSPQLSSGNTSRSSTMSRDRWPVTAL